MAYDFEGTGYPLLFIHGYPLNRKMWKPQISNLKNICKIVAPDLRGFGDSTSVAGIYTMEILAEDCYALLKHLQIKQPIYICGLSMGGYVAMAFLRKYPDIVAGIILSATRAEADTFDIRKTREKTAETVTCHGINSIIDLMASKLFAPETYHKKPQLVEDVKYLMKKSSVDGVQGALLGMSMRESSLNVLAKCKKPILVIHGADDQLIPIDEAEAMYHGSPNSQFIVIPEAGHLPNLEQPNKFNEAIYNFIVG